MNLNPAVVLNKRKQRKRRMNKLVCSTKTSSPSGRLEHWLCSAQTLLSVVSCSDRIAVFGMNNKFDELAKAYVFSVAQIFNLPYRRFLIGRASVVPETLDFANDTQVRNVRNLRYSRLQVCATTVGNALNRYAKALAQSWKGNGRL